MNSTPLDAITEQPGLEVHSLGSYVEKGVEESSSSSLIEIRLVPADEKGHPIRFGWARHRETCEIGFDLVLETRRDLCVSLSLFFCGRLSRVHYTV